MKAEVAGSSLVSHPFVMISKLLSRIIILSFVLNILHMIEVVWSKFPSVAYSGIAKYFYSINDAIYFSSHVPLYLFMMLLFFSHINKKVLKWVLIAYSWIFISESHHFLHALLDQKYYPGAVTSLMYILLGCFYIRQLYNDFRSV